MDGMIRFRRRAGWLGLIFAGISLAAYIASRILIFPDMNENAHMQAMLFRVLRNDLWMYLLLLVLPVLTIALCGKNLSKGAVTALKVISIIYLCIQVMASVLNCIFLYSGVSSFYTMLLCTAAGRELITSFTHLIIQGPNWRIIIQMVGEICALAATLMCAAAFSKKRFQNKNG